MKRKMLYVRSYWGEKIKREHRTLNIGRRTVEENANIEHRTPNFQRRTEENQERKETPSVCSFRLFGSTFGVECSMFDVRINLQM